MRLDLQLFSLYMVAGFISIVLSGYFGTASLLWISVILITIREGLFDPAYNNILSRSVSEHKQGKLQGVNQGLHSSYEIFGPFAAGIIYLYNPLSIYIIATLFMITTLLYFCKKLESLRMNTQS